MAFPFFSHSTTPRQGPHVHQPWSCNTVINCGGVVVRPGDAIIGDQDGAVVIPASHAQQVYDIAHSREVIEEIVKEELTKNPDPLASFTLHVWQDKTKLSSRSTSNFQRSQVRTLCSSPWNETGRSNSCTHRRHAWFSSHCGPGNMSTYTQTEAHYQSVLKQFAEHKACAVLRTPDRWGLHLL